MDSIRVIKTILKNKIAVIPKGMTAFLFYRKLLYMHFLLLL